MVRTTERNARTDVDAPIAATRAMLREHGLHECDGRETSGFVLRIEGRDGFSLEFCEPAEDGRSASEGTSFRRAIAAFSACCAALVDRGHSVTLIASPRILALYVRHD